MQIEQIGGCTLYRGDCLEIMPTLGKVDAVVTDPPYGIGVDAIMAKQSGSKYGNAAAAKSNYRTTDWDSAPIGPCHLATIMKASTIQVIFGGNYFELPPARCWLIWDKENGTNAFADAEMAWTNLDKPIRLIRHMWNGMLRKSGEDRVGHPTQKPVGVMEWCLEFLPNSQTILDPFMGSGTTGVAYVNLNRKFIGIELDQKYFDIACKRIEDAVSRPRLDLPEPIQPKQEAFILSTQESKEP